MRKFVLLVVLLLPLTAFAQKPVVPKGWKVVNSCGTDLALPDLKKEPVGFSRDACGEEFKSQDMSVYMQRRPGGVQFNKADNFENYLVTKIDLNGREATLITYFEKGSGRNVAIAYVPIGLYRIGVPMESIILTIHTKPSVDNMIIKRIYESLEYITI